MKQIRRFFLKRFLAYLRFLSQAIPGQQLLRPDRAKQPRIHAAESIVFAQGFTCRAQRLQFPALIQRHTGKA